MVLDHQTQLYIGIGLAFAAGAIGMVKVPALAKLVSRLFGQTTPAAQNTVGQPAALAIVPSAPTPITPTGGVAQPPVPVNNVAPHPLLQDIKDLEATIVSSAQQRGQEDLAAFRKSVQSQIKSWMQQSSVVTPK